ncbi:radical SAM family heme chaperone HemW [Geotalea toluenoxydans]|uniref:radical SAM family heme chaperone HemW n=1 Tax=Geotalea toluenoxydans TaxID=421624 RepID=UPI000A550948|nr:radical SAM family heme chaperone HemW [Geotalea toluenoxydans]
MDICRSYGLSFLMHVSLYIHFPFCLKKCLYCDFDSVAGSLVSPDEYVAAVVREMELRAGQLAAPVSAPTLYFGGGTPSLMAPQLVGRVIDTAARLYGLDTDAEITIEANPGTVTAEKLAGYRAAGVNRLSLGVQALDDALLQQLGRVHSVEESLAAYKAARKAGFDNIGFDLIHSLPGQSLTIWEKALGEAIRLGPEHISAYSLSVEEGTPFAAMFEAGVLNLPHEDEATAMFEATRHLLALHGYEHYEISNFARPLFKSRHNQVYWRRGNYLGFGAGAHSFLREPGWGLRWVNPRNHTAYLAAMQQDQLQEEELQQLARRDALAEAFFLGLRLLEGVDMQDAIEEFGPVVEEEYGGLIGELEGKGLLMTSGRHIAIPQDKIIFANRIFSSFI